MTDRPVETVADNNSSGSNVASPRSSTDSRPPSGSLRSLRLSSHLPNHQHRQSISDSLRAAPGSPRARRQPSLTQSAIQSLIDNPPAPNNVNPAFVGRDWREISIGELVSPDDLKFVEVDTGIEEATNILIDSGAAVLLIRESPQNKSAVGTFDYSDLNAYLLLAAGLTQPGDELLASYEQLARKAKEGLPIPLRDVKDLGRKEPLTTLPASASVMTAVQTFGGGVHRVVVVNERDNNEVVGIFSQFRLVKFLWENGRSFPVIDQLYPQSLHDLRIGSRDVISINGDRPLVDALQIMNDEGISSIAVVDNHFNVVGNISTTDVKLLTRSSSLPLLRNTCTHFISVILSNRGLEEGKDSFPVFHVNPGSTLAHTVAKVVATRSHRAHTSREQPQPTAVPGRQQRQRDASPHPADGIPERAIDAGVGTARGTTLGTTSGGSQPDGRSQPARTRQRTESSGSGRKSQPTATQQQVWGIPGHWWSVAERVRCLGFLVGMHGLGG
ncbi:hypothetical protein BO78DRAFT_408662 [Aspergillus sclerotiicarbonarius CBS 121057]|uniref:CBS domain-containing protein n=1 Tax=Aspergillus sclerotiicarbonarius (strain CBS 121057 / IBT 28362) TaxID=1448318 RepID=A0A319EMB7_ASPSB|nr:hypothetical protein BO78DRAFT_408662 [Aspergillus sclerotiicarbonarius CBS 121057]